MTGILVFAFMATAIVAVLGRLVGRLLDIDELSTIHDGGRRWRLDR